MKNKTFKAIAIMLLASLPLLASAHTLDLPITTTQTGNKVEFQSVRIEHDKTGQHVIKGQLRRLARDPVHFGHLDYVVLDNAGKTLETGQVNYSPAIRLRHVNHPSYFTVSSKVGLESGSTVQLGWSADPMHDNSH